jgi:hypothetical protein
MRPFDAPVERASSTLLVRAPLTIDPFSMDVVNGFEVVETESHPTDCELVSPFELIDRGVWASTVYSPSGFKNRLLVLGVLASSANVATHSIVHVVDRGIQRLFDCLCGALGVETSRMRYRSDLDVAAGAIVVASTLSLPFVLARVDARTLFSYSFGADACQKVRVTYPFVRQEKLPNPLRSDEIIDHALVFHMVVACRDAKALRNPIPYRGQGSQALELRDYLLPPPPLPPSVTSWSKVQCDRTADGECTEPVVFTTDVQPCGLVSSKAFVKCIELRADGRRELACLGAGTRFVLTGQAIDLENGPYRVTRVFDKASENRRQTHRWIAATNALPLPRVLDLTDAKTWSIVDVFSRYLHVYEKKPSVSIPNCLLATGDIFCDNAEDPKVRYKIVQIRPTLRVLEDVDPGKARSQCLADDETSCLLGYSDLVAKERANNQCTFDSDCPYFLKGAAAHRPYPGRCRADKQCEMPIGTEDGGAPYCAGCPSTVHPTECCVLQGPESARYAFAILEDPE